MSIAQSLYRSLVFAAAFGSVAVLEARPWTNLDGKVIEADFVRIDGSDVVISKGGKEFSVPIDQLSTADQAWLDAQQAESQEAAAETLSALTGLRKDVPIDRAQFPAEKYFDGDLREAWAAKLKGGHYNNHGDQDYWLAREPGEYHCQVYCPPSYDGSEPYGLYLYILPSGKGQIPASWHPVLDELKLIAVAADRVGNSLPKDEIKDNKTNPFPRRISISLDAMATVEAQYNIDPKRRIVGGLSGGGHMAFLTAALYPELFKGAVSCAAQSYLPNHFSAFTIKDIKHRDRRHLRWIVVSGEKDGNYPIIIKESKVWEDERLDYKFLDVPGMGHHSHRPEAMMTALRWVDRPEE